jgi:undecaprenyl-diphosphatase
LDPIAARLLELLPVYGPAFLFVLAVLETSFVTGLVIPSGVATSLATVLALEGRLDLAAVWVAALAGGAVGDSLGFWIGRLWGRRLMSGRGRIASAFRARHERVAGLLRGHPLYSVTVARLISFVRTLMPMGAGMSGLRYRTFLPFELVGLVGWVVLYAGIGALARESWQMATRVVGIGGAVAFAGVGAVVWTVWRRRARRGFAAGAVAPTGTGSAGEAVGNEIVTEADARAVTPSERGPSSAPGSPSASSPTSANPPSGDAPAPSEPAGAERRADG